MEMFPIPRIDSIEINFGLEKFLATSTGDLIACLLFKSTVNFFNEDSFLAGYFSIVFYQPEDVNQSI
jgi:hypothetical protein